MWSLELRLFALLLLLLLLLLLVVVVVVVVVVSWNSKHCRQPRAPFTVSESMADVT